MSGWLKLKCRRFAANLRTQDVLERVEFAWFTNDQLAVTVSRTSTTSGSQLMAQTEVYFYDSIPLHSTTHSLSPTITVRIRDAPLCSFCKSSPKGECKCLRDSDPLMFPVSPSASTTTGSSQHFSLSPTPQTMTWEMYLRSMMRCKLNGFLTCVISTPDATGAAVERVRVMHAYSLTFGTEEAINEGIHLRLKQMLLARPTISPTPSLPLVGKIDWQTARSKTTKELEADIRAPGKSPNPLVSPFTRVNMAQSSLIPTPWAGGTAIPLSDCTERAQRRMREREGNADRGATASSLESIPSLPIASEIQYKQRLNSGVVAEKTGKSCDSTPNPFLSTILNSNKDVPATPTTLTNFAEMSALMPPAQVPQTPKSANSLFSSAPTQLGEAFGIGMASPARLRTATQSYVLPSPISMIMDFNESAKKKARTEGYKEDGVFGLSFDAAAAAWDGNLEDNDRIRRQRDFSWTTPGLGRALGMEGSPSPFLGKTPTALGGSLLSDRQLQPGSRIEIQRAYIPPAPSRREDQEALPEDNETKEVRCEECGATFSKKANLVRHTKTVHNNVKPFGCTTCGSRFGLKADLQRHQRNIHEKRAFCCRTCGKSYSEQEELDFHNRVAHEKDSRPFECAQCGMRFGRRSSRRRHEQTVHTDKRFNCNLCDKSYSQRFDMIKHGRRAHGIGHSEKTAQKPTGTNASN